jgi:hypothetical protein
MIFLLPQSSKSCSLLSLSFAGYLYGGRPGVYIFMEILEKRIL